MQINTQKIGYWRYGEEDEEIIEISIEISNDTSPKKIYHKIDKKTNKGEEMKIDIKKNEGKIYLEIDFKKAEHYFEVTGSLKRGDKLECDPNIMWDDGKKHRAVKKRFFIVSSFPSDLNRKITQLLSQ